MHVRQSAESRTLQNPAQLRARFFSVFESRPAFLSGVVLFAFILRMIVVTVVVRAVSADTLDSNNFGWESWEMGWTARSIFLGHGFSSPFLPMTGSTALVPPLYPYFMAGMFKLFGLNTLKAAFAILSFNSVCSSLTCIPLYFLTRHALNERLARIVSFAWAIYPFSIYFAAGRVWDYAVTSLLFTCCLLIAQKLHFRSNFAWVGFGLLYGIAALSNPSVVSLLPFLLLIALYKVWRTGGAWFTKGLLVTLAFVAVCTPWTIRNERVMHANFFIRDGFGLEFYAGNNGDTFQSNTSWVHPASNSDEMKKYEALGEIAYMAEKHALGVDFVKHHPLFFAESCVRRVVRFWTGFWSFLPAYVKDQPLDLPNIPFCLFLVYFMVRGLILWWREDKGAALPYLIAVLVFPLPYYLTHSSMDYRQPLEPIMILLVSVGLFGTADSRVPSDEEAEEFELELEPEAVLV